MLFLKMKSPLNILLLLLLSTVFFSCDNDLDIIDNYRETPIIYGLLNLSQDTQYVRVQRAYLGEGNALMMAQNSDSIYYNQNEISLFLEERVFGVLRKTIPLIPDNSYLKDDGLFANYPHLIYRTDSVKLDKDAQYKLVFNNNKTGKTITGVTHLTDNIPPPVVLSNVNKTINLASENPLKVKISSVKNGKVYGLHVLFFYVERNLTDPTNTYHLKSLDFKLNDIVSNFSTFNPNQTIEFLMYPDDFFRFIGDRIPIDSSTERRALQTSMDFIFTTGAEDFYIYYTANQSSSSLSESVPDFTNLSEGRGVFSSRNTNIFDRIKLNSASIDSLVFGRYTHNRFSY